MKNEEAAAAAARPQASESEVCSVFSNFYLNLESMSKYDLFALPRSLPACKKHSIELRLLQLCIAKSPHYNSRYLLGGCSSHCNELC